MAGQIIEQIFSDENYLIKNNTFIRKGYEFICWNTKADGTGIDIYENSISSFLQDVTLYAKWKFKYGFINLITTGNVTITGNNTKVTIPANLNSEVKLANAISFTNSNSITIILKININDFGQYSSDTLGYSILGLRDSTYATDNNDKDFELYVDSNKRLVFKLTNSTSEQLLKVKQEQYIKFVKNCSNYDIYVSDNGITYTLFIHANSTKEFYNKYLYIGTGYIITKYETRTELGDPIYSTKVVGKEWIPTCGVDAGRRKDTECLHYKKSGHGYFTYKYEQYCSGHKTKTVTDTKYTIMKNLQCTLVADESYVNVSNTDYQMRLI